LNQTWAELIIKLSGLYAGIGALFALAFVLRGVQRIDPAARGAGWGFRLVIFPGSVALWPLLAWRWLRGRSQPPTEHNAHRGASG